MMRGNIHPLQHLSGDVLLRLHDGELPAAEAERAQQHLRTCWECRLRAERFSNAVLRLVEYCDSVVELHGGVPDTLREFQARLRQQAEQQVEATLTGKRRWWSSWLAELVAQPQVATVCLAIVLMVLWTFFGGTVPVASAEELLSESLRAESLVASEAARPIVHQRLDLTAGPARVEWELWHEPRERRFRGHWNHDGGLAEEMHEFYARNGWDERRPLSASAFSSWRASLVDRSDHVFASDDGRHVTIQTLNNAAIPGLIREARLTLRSADMHPVEQYFLVLGSGHDREFRIREIEFAAVGPEQAPEGFFPRNPEIRRAPAPVIRTRDAAPLSEEQWQTAEVRARQALHALALDTRLIPEFERGNSQLAIRLIAESTGQKASILDALRRIPNLVPEVLDPDSPAGLMSAEPLAESPAESTPEPSYRTDPPLNQELIEYFGTLDLANDYVRDVHGGFRGLIADALALQRLAARYPESELSKLPVRSRETVRQIAVDHIAVVTARWPELSGLLQPLLEEMRRRRSVEFASLDSSIGPCLSWREAGASLAPALRELESAFNLLFVIREQQASITIDADSTLSQADALRRRLDSDTSRLCGL